MAEAQRVEIGFEGGQVISAGLAEDDLKDLRKQLEKGGWHDLHTCLLYTSPSPRDRS